VIVLAVESAIILGCWKCDRRSCRLGWGYETQHYFFPNYHPISEL